MKKESMAKSFKHRTSQKSLASYASSNVIVKDSPIKKESLILRMSKSKTIKFPSTNNTNNKHNNLKKQQTEIFRTNNLSNMNKSRKSPIPSPNKKIKEEISKVLNFKKSNFQVFNKKFNIPFDPIRTSLKEHKDKIINFNYYFTHTNLVDYVSDNKIKEYIKTINEMENNAENQRYNKEFKESKIILTAKGAINDLMFIKSLDEESCFKSRKQLFRKFKVSIDKDEIFILDENKGTDEEKESIIKLNEFDEDVQVNQKMKNLDCNYLKTVKKFNDYMTKYKHFKDKFKSI